MPALVIDRQGVPVLGQRKRADELVQWSLKHKAGKKFVEDFAFGLRVGFISSDSEPKMYIHWNQQKLWKFLDSIGGAERFVVIKFGICVEHDQGRTQVKILGAGKTSRMLWDSLENNFSRQHSFRDQTDNVNWLVGMVRFSEQGPILLTQVECQQELEEAAAVAVIDTSKKENKFITPPEKLLGNDKQLSTSARAHLLQDVLTSLLIKQSKLTA